MTVFTAVAMLGTVAMVASYLPPGAPLTLIRLPRYAMNEFRKMAGDPQRKEVMLHLSVSRSD
jgi:hypothetical protein